MKLVSKTLVAAIAAIGLHGAAQATGAKFDLDTLPIGSYEYERTGLKSGFLNLFTVIDRFDFRLHDSNPLSTFNLSIEGELDRKKGWIGKTAVFGLYQVQNDAGSSTLQGGLQTFSAGVAQYSNLQAGNYFVKVLGGGFGKPGDYTLTFNATAVTPPVPEASEWAMLMAGLGVVGAIARRRQKKAA